MIIYIYILTFEKLIIILIIIIICFKNVKLFENC